MAIDKLRLGSGVDPCDAFLAAVNDDQQQPEDYRRFIVNHLGDEAETTITKYSHVRIRTKSGVGPGFFVEINFPQPGAGRHLPLPDLNLMTGETPVDLSVSTRQHRIRTIIEFNPNRFLNGWQGAQMLVAWIMGEIPDDLKLTRCDFNAETGVTVHYLWQSLRIQFKRRSDDIGGEDLRLFKNKGVETFYVGRPPSRLRVYDKRREMEAKGEEVGYLPKVFTRIEVELRHDHCPVSKFTKLPELVNYRPFEKLRLLDVPAYYDFRNEPKISLKRLLYHSLVNEVGAQDAYRIFNSDRNFSRDFKDMFVDNDKLKAQIEENYALTLSRFFENKGCDVSHVYQLEAMN